MISRPGLDPGPRPTASHEGPGRARDGYTMIHWIVFGLLTYFVVVHLWVGDVVTDMRTIGDQAQFLYRGNQIAGVPYQRSSPDWVDVSWFTYYLARFTAAVHLAVVVVGAVCFVVMGGLKRIWND